MWDLRTSEFLLRGHAVPLQVCAGNMLMTTIVYLPEDKWRFLRAESSEGRRVGFRTREEEGRQDEGMDRQSSSTRMEGCVNQTMKKQERVVEGGGEEVGGEVGGEAVEGGARRRRSPKEEERESATVKVRGAAVKVRRKFPIFLYLHGDQFRSRKWCPLPGLGNFNFPTVSSGPIKYLDELMRAGYGEGGNGGGDDDNYDDDDHHRDLAGIEEGEGRRKEGKASGKERRESKERKDNHHLEGGLEGSLEGGVERGLERGLEGSLEGGLEGGGYDEGYDEQVKKKKKDELATFKCLASSILLQPCCDFGCYWFRGPPCRCDAEMFHLGTANALRKMIRLVSANDYEDDIYQQENIRIERDMQGENANVGVWAPVAGRRRQRREQRRRRNQREQQDS